MEHPRAKANEVSCDGGKVAGSRVHSRSARPEGDLSPEVIERLCEALRDAVPSVRAAAAKTLGDLGVQHPGVRSEVARLLDDVDPDVRASATRALAALGRSDTPVSHSSNAQLSEVLRQQWADSHVERVAKRTGLGHEEARKLLQNHSWNVQAAVSQIDRMNASPYAWSDFVLVCLLGGIGLIVADGHAKKYPRCRVTEAACTIGAAWVVLQAIGLFVGLLVLLVAVGSG